MISFKPLWKTLIDKNLTREDLREALKLSSTTIANMGKNKDITTKTLNRICSFLNCKIEDVIEYVPDQISDSSNEN